MDASKEIEIETQIASSEEITSSENNSDVEAGAVKGKSGLVTAFPRTKPFIVVVASCAALGGLIFGYDIAGAGATFVMDGFQRHFGWECAPDDLDCTAASDGEIDRDKGLINGLFGMGATFGAILNPYFAEKYGRRPCLFLSTLVFIVGASIQTAAPLMWVMWLGRVFSGMGIGMLSMCVPVYIAECSPEHMRGTLGTLWQVAVTTGILIASAANLGLSKWDEGWRLSYGGNIIFAFILLACLVVMPESPRWLAGHASDEDLTLALKKLRYDDEIETEKQKLHQEVEEEKSRGEAPWREVFSTSNTMRRRVFLGMSLQAFQQLCGINAIMFYAPDILNTFFTEDQAIAGAFYLNAINFLATFIAVAAIDKFGRVKLLLYDVFLPRHQHNFVCIESNANSWMVRIGLCIFLHHWFRVQLGPSGVGCLRRDVPPSHQNKSSWLDHNDELVLHHHCWCCLPCCLARVAFRLLRLLCRCYCLGYGFCVPF
jgi:SP family sugar:H+ symporter-like MFS transporter